MIEFIQTLLVACIPAAITGVIAYAVAHKNASSQIKIVKEQNKNVLEKLMQQHAVDIDSLKEKYRLEAEEKDREHTRKLEIMEKEYEYRLKQQESEAENAAKYSAIKDIFGGVICSMVNTPEMQQQMSTMISDAFNKRTDK